VIEDPRTVFYLPQDAQAIIYFEWEGPAGKHHFEGFWKNPEGKVASLSDFDYVAPARRFGAYWTLSLAGAIGAGTWTLEAHIDGETAGSHTIQIVLGTRAGEDTPRRRMLKPAEIYQRTLTSTVSIERLGGSGERLGRGSGFLLAPNLIVTAFQSIDGASKLRILFSDGSSFETDQVVSWNRRQDWAVLKWDGSKKPVLERAAADSWNIGDMASYLEVAPEGNLVIANVTIDGKNSFPSAGERISISAAPTDGAAGAALVNDYGEAIGVVGGSLVPGANSTTQLILSTPQTHIGGTLHVRGGMAVPISAIPLPTAEAAGTPLATLAAKGDFLPPVTAGRNIASAQLARSVEKKDGMTWASEGSSEFSRQQGKMIVYVFWEAKENCSGNLTMRIFDLDNQPLNRVEQVKPLKLKLHPRERFVSSWEANISALATGIYRVDMWLDDAPAWGAFFRVTD
jgi:S1-C subfamily serine protease